MKFRLNYIPNELVRTVVAEQLNKLDVPFTFNEIGHLVIANGLSKDRHRQLRNALQKYGLTLSESGDNSIVQNIKIAIEEMLFSEDIRTKKISVYLSEKLDYSYSYLSNLFSEETYTSIENFVILRKIEYAKKLILDGNMNLTEIAQKLDYSSVAHLSGQFKKVTGLTPTVFLRILEKRKSNTLN